MKKEVLLNFEYLDLTIFAFFLFLMVFVGTILWINRKGSKDVYKSIENLPLEDGLEERV